MKPLKNIIILLCVLFAVNAKAQNVSAQLARSYWMSEGSMMDSTLLTNQSTVTKQLIIFKFSDSFERSVFFHDPVTGRFDTLIFYGTYSLTQKGKTGHFRTDFIRRNTNRTEINWVADAEIKLTGDNNMNLFGINYSRQNDAYPVYTYLSYRHEDLVERSFYVQNLGDPTRRVAVPYNTRLQFREKEADPLRTLLRKTVYCTIDSLSKDSIYLDVTEEHLEFLFKNESTRSVQNNYPFVHQRSVADVYDLSYLQLRTPFRKAMTGTARFIFWCSFIDLAISTLVHKNYPLQDAMVAGGVSGLVVSIPFAILGAKKTFWLADRNSQRKTDWKLVEVK